MLIMNELRSDYLTNKITHETYYKKLSETIGKTELKEIIEKSNVNNDSPLNEWDDLGNPIFHLYKEAVNCNKIDDKGVPFNLSMAVSIAKYVYKNY